MFEVNTEELKKCSTQLNTYADALKNNGNRLLDVCSALSGLGGMELVIETIHSLSETLGKESAFTENLAEAAGRIAHKYELAEDQILNYVESSGRDGLNDNVSVSNFSDRSGMNESVKETLEDIDKLVR